MTRLCNSFKRIFSKARCRPKRRRPKVPQGILTRHKSFEPDSPQLTQKSPNSEDKTLDIQDTSPDPILPKSAPSLPHAVKAEVSGRNDFEWEVLWHRAYEIVNQQHPDLIVDFEKHLETSTKIEIPPLVEKDLLSSPESAQKIVEQLQTDRAEKQWRVKIMGNNVSVREQVEKLGRFLLWSDEIVKSALSAQPYASMAWSGVSMLAPLLSVGTVQHEAMLEGFGSICDIQMYWWSYKEKIAKSSSQGNDTGLVETLPKLFSLVFEYQARVICHLSKNQLSRALEKAVCSSDWASLQSLAVASHGTCKEYVTRGHNEEVETHMTLQSEKMERSCQTGEKILQTLQQGQRESWERELLNNLASAAPTYERDKNFNADRVEGTCEWFFRDSTFCNWRDNQSSSLIWISAGPGCGKSVLSRALIDEGHLDTSSVVEITDSTVYYRDSPSTICYFFFKDQDALRMNPTSALCAMLHQLFCGISSKSLIRYAKSSHRNYNTHLTTNLSELWRILIACAESPELNGLVCVLDALDECSEESREELFFHLRRFYSEKRDLKSSKIKFLLTGRPYDHLKSGLQRLENHAAYIHYDGDDKFEEIGRDIDLVIDAKVDSLRQYIKKENDRDRIRKRLKSMDNRTYLWLHLTWDIITKDPSKYGRVLDIESLLSDIPPAVEDAYEKILNRSTDIKRTEALLQLVLAAKRPLTIEEANYALTLTTTSTITKDEPLTHKVLSENIWSSDFKSVVKNLCGLFINVYDSKLYFIHQTAREFLTSPGKSDTGWRGRFDMQMAHSLASRCCLRYLLLSNTSMQMIKDSWRAFLRRGNPYPFREYAEDFLPFHFDSQGDDAKENGLEDMEALFHSSAPKDSAYMAYNLGLNSLRRAFSDVGQTDNVECNKLLLATHFGLPQAVRRILETRNQTKDTSYTAKVAALRLASEKGQLEVLKVLLLHTRSADLDTKSFDGTTALHAAACHGYLGIVRLLLLNGANTEISGDDGTPLFAAADRGLKKVIDMLLSHRANAQNYSGFYETPLSKVAERGSDDAVEILLPITCVGELSLTFFGVALQRALVSGGNVLDRLMSFLETLEPNEGYHQTIVLWAARYADPINMPCLLQKWRNRISVTEKLLVAATRNKYNAPKMITTLLDECESNELISTHVIMSAILARNAKTTNVLLQRCNIQNVDTQAIILAAAKKGKVEDMALLLNLCDYDIQAIAEAAVSGSEGTKKFRLIFQKHGDQIVATENLLQVAAENKGHNGSLLTLIYECYGKKIVITERMLEAAAARWESRELEYLLDYCDGHTTITEPILRAAAANKWTRDTFEILIKNYQDKITITEGVLRAAAANEKHGYRIFKMLIGNYRDNITITEGVLKAAAQNIEFGLGIFQLIINNCGTRLAVTEAVVKAATTCGQEGILDLLYKANCQGSGMKEWHGINKFWISIKHGDLPTTKQLIREGQDLEETNARGEKPLIFALKEGTPEAVELLVQTTGINLNLADRNGRVPLHATMRPFPRYDIISTLLKAGADPRLLGEDFLKEHLPWLSVT